jgi:hypothetical protein
VGASYKKSFMTKKFAFDTARRFFENNDGLHELNITSNGRAFENIHNAIGQTKTLDDKEVYTVTRAECTKPADDAEVAQKPADDALDTVTGETVKKSKKKKTT